jgi:hypothetical protein
MSRPRPKKLDAARLRWRWDSPDFQPETMGFCRQERLSASGFGGRRKPVRYVNPLVEGSSPSPVTTDRTRQRATRHVETPGNPGVFSLSTPEHSIPSSRQKTTQADSNRPPITPPPQYTCQTDPDLARIAEAWPGLPESVRASILMLVNAASDVVRPRGSTSLQCNIDPRGFPAVRSGTTRLKRTSYDLVLAELKKW